MLGAVPGRRLLVLPKPRSRSWQQLPAPCGGHSTSSSRTTRCLGSPVSPLQLAANPGPQPPARPRLLELDPRHKESGVAGWHRICPQPFLCAAWNEPFCLLVLLFPCLCFAV